MTDLDARIRHAETLAASPLLPAHLRGQAPNVLLLLEIGEALGIPPVQALTSLAVVGGGGQGGGRITMSSDLMAAVVRRAGHKLRVREHDGAVTAEIIRADDPEFVFSVTWDRKKAEIAGLWGRKGPWQQHPMQMLRARAISEVCRQAASDAMAGVIHTPEEISAIDDTAAPQVPPSAGSAPSAGVRESGRHRLVREHLERASLDLDVDEVLAAAQADGVRMAPDPLTEWLAETYPAGSAPQEAADTPASE